MFSYWEEEYWKLDFDFVIIGLGIVGINTAIDLKTRFPNASIAVLERGGLPTGASTKNAGFACFGTVGEILHDLNTQTEAQVIETIKMRWKGLELLKNRVPLSSMHYQNNGGTEVFISDEQFEKRLSRLHDVNDLIEQFKPMDDPLL